MKNTSIIQLSAAVQKDFLELCWYDLSLWRHSQDFGYACDSTYSKQL